MSEEFAVFALQEYVHFRNGSQWYTTEVYYRRETAWKAARNLIELIKAWNNPLKRRDVRTIRMIARKASK